jgi:hypothetical protein
MNAVQSRRFMFVALCVAAISMYATGCGPGGSPIQRDDCHMRMVACQNRCGKLDMGVLCDACCYNQARKCDSDADSYSFSSCTE